MTSLFDRRQWVREVHLVGLGGIGSWVAFWLLKLGLPEIHVYDDDIVEPHNVFFQLWGKADIGTTKVSALIDFADSESLDTNIIPHVTRVKEDSRLAFSGVVISGLDSVASRIAIWKHLRYNEEVELYMDGRIGGDAFQLYTLNPSDPSQIEIYESWLRIDGEARHDPCAQRDDFHAAVALGGFILKNLTSFARGERPAEIYQGDLSIVAVDGGATVVQIP